ncbi:MULTISPECIES: hypothetical protein [unclassified Massilia]|nr:MULTISPECIES: hypothetical protein [unclassified Massilia]
MIDAFARENILVCGFSRWAIHAIAVGCLVGRGQAFGSVKR